MTLGTAALGEADWDQPEIELMFGHPDDDPLLRSLKSQGTSTVVSGPLRPFKGTREPNLFDRV